MEKYSGEVPRVDKTALVCMEKKILEDEMMNEVKERSYFDGTLL